MAATVIVAALALFGGVGLVVWNSLPSLPAVEEMRAASAAAANAPVARAVRTEPASRVAAVAPTLSRDPLPAAGLERLPARPGPESAADARPARYKLVIIESADLINVRSRLLRLAYVDAPEADARCTNASGRNWPCGARARTALRRLVRARALDCRDHRSGAPAATALATDAARSAAAPAARDIAPVAAPDRATCTVGDVDLGRWLIEQGWASPTEDAPGEFAQLHADAKAAKRGLFEPAAR